MLSFRDKLLASHLLVVLVVVASIIFGLSRALSSDLEQELDARLEKEARGTTAWFAEAGMRHPDKITARIAAIVHADVALADKDGHVLSDTSTPAALGTEPEFEDARKNEIGKATRRVSSGDEVHFVAVRASDGHVLRLAAPLSGIAETVNRMRDRLVAASLGAVVLALLLAMLFARVAVRPLNEMTTAAEKLARGDYDVDAPATKDEFGTLGKTLLHLASELKARIGDLTSERDRLSAILRGMVEGVLVFDRDGKVILENPAAKRMLKGAMLGKSLDDAMPMESVREQVTRCMDGETQKQEMEVQNGTATLVVYVSPLGEEGEDAHGVVVVMRDLTEVRRLLTVRRDFVANVSHELRTPIAAVQGYAETLLQSQPSAETQRSFLEIIFRQSQRMGVLVQQLLSLSEIEARRPEDVELALVDVGHVAADVASAVRGRAGGTAANIEVVVPPDTLAYADGEGLERVLVNLVDNAVKYGKTDGKVTVSATRDGTRIQVIVSDEGAGIEPVHLPRLFERFYRVDEGRTREKGGAGLGLAIVKHLVDVMGGEITVESELGKGTKFIVSLRAATPSQHATASS
jgi:two-component system phosphate regulon sensor histidine kinase PhoR